jgi:restriction system protein
MHLIDIWLFLKITWQIWAIIGIILLVRIIFETILPGLFYGWKNKIRFKAGEKWRSEREMLYWLRSMNPKEFEEYIANLFSHMGYETTITGGSHDEGVDVIAEKDGVKHYIQCKKFISSIVHVGDIRDFYGAIADHLANGKAYFITTNKFTHEAEQFAEDKPIELVDGFGLVKYIRSVENNK